MDAPLETAIQQAKRLECDQSNLYLHYSFFLDNQCVIDELLLEK